MEEKNNIVIYQLEDGKTKIDVKLDDETVWLSQQQMADLYDTTKQNISLHIKNIFDEEELIENSTVKEFLTVQKEGNRNVERKVKYYNLDMIISLGYRIKSKVATNFRRWATERLKEYMIKGFTMDDERLKGNGGGNYWKELLARIKDIRSSEKVLYRQVLDLYATAVDYNPKDSKSIEFFKIVQNKIHYAAYLMDRENISQGLYGMFVSASLYHGGAFTGILKAIFVFIIPSLLLGVIPVELIKSMSFSNICLILLLTILWLTTSITFFYKSLKKYESNNFFGFGN